MRSVEKTCVFLMDAENEFWMSIDLCSSVSRCITKLMQNVHGERVEQGEGA